MSSSHKNNDNSINATTTTKTPPNVTNIMSVTSPHRTLSTRPAQLTSPRDGSPARWCVPPTFRAVTEGWAHVLALIPCYYITNCVLAAYGTYYVVRRKLVLTNPFDPWFNKSSKDPVGHPNQLPGSSELDTATGRNCALPCETWDQFAQFVIGEHLADLEPNGTIITNIVFGDVWTCANMWWKIQHHCLEPNDLFWLAVSLARMTWMLIGSMSLNQYIWDMVYFDTFGKESDAAFRRATSISICMRNQMHAMTNDTTLNANHRPPIDDTLLSCLPAPHRQILEMLRENDSVTYPREAVSSGQPAVNILMQRMMGEGLTFEELCIRWYREALTEYNRTDEMGLTNGILRAYGYVEVGDTMESINTPKRNNNTSARLKTEGLDNTECDDSVDSTPLTFTGDF